MDPKKTLTVKATINADVAKVWDYYTKPEHITKWNNASEDWHTPKAENDLRVGGRFLSRMESRDGKDGFDFTGVYTVVETNKRIDYTMDDGRKASITFDGSAGSSQTNVTVSFEMETENSRELQESGWQAILDNFKKYVEAN